MKKKISLRILTGALCVLMMLIFVSCGGQSEDSDYSGEEYDESFSAESLAGDYADQLIRDGASIVTGTLTISGEENAYQVTAQEKKVVINSDYEDGYYVADRNMENTWPLGSDHGVVASVDGTPVMMDIPEFIEHTKSDTDALYQIYLINDTVELILPLDPETLVHNSDN